MRDPQQRASHPHHGHPPPPAHAAPARRYDFDLARIQRAVMRADDVDDCRQIIALIRMAARQARGDQPVIRHLAMLADATHVTRAALDDDAPLDNIVFLARRWMQLYGGRAPDALAQHVADVLQANQPQPQPPPLVAPAVAPVGLGQLQIADPVLAGLPPRRRRPRPPAQLPALPQPALPQSEVTDDDDVDFDALIADFEARDDAAAAAIAEREANARHEAVDAYLAADDGTANDDLFANIAPAHAAPTRTVNQIRRDQFDQRIDNAESFAEDRRERVYVQQGQGAYGRLDRVVLFSAAFSSCTPLLAWNAQTRRGGLFHVSGGAVAGQRAEIIAMLRWVQPTHVEHYEPNPGQLVARSAQQEQQHRAALRQTVDDTRAQGLHTAQFRAVDRRVSKISLTWGGQTPTVSFDEPGGHAAWRNLATDDAGVDLIVARSAHYANLNDVYPLTKLPRPMASAADP